MKQLNREHEKARTMSDTAQMLISMIQKRASSRMKALEALEATPMDMLPDVVSEMRETESRIMRAVLQEQNDLIEIIQMLFPMVPVAPAAVEEKPKRKRANRNAAK
jgi:hypothetical protein